MEYYLAINKKELSVQVAPPVNLSGVLPSERRKSQKVTHCMIPFMWHSGKSKSTRTREASSGCQRQGVVTAKDQHTEVFYTMDPAVLDPDCGDKQICTRTIDLPETSIGKFKI